MHIFKIVQSIILFMQEASVPMTEVAAAGVEKNKTSDSEDSGCCTPLDGDPITAPPPTSGDDGSTTTSALQSVQEEELDKGAVTLPKKKDPTKKKKRSGLRKFWRSKRCHVYLQALTMTFLAEWGDRSQLAVIVIAATENIWGTCVGCLLGHAICCSIAVVGGRLIAKKISVKTGTKDFHFNVSFLLWPKSLANSDGLITFFLFLHSYDNRGDNVFGIRNNLLNFLETVDLTFIS